VTVAHASAGYEGRVVGVKDQVKVRLGEIDTMLYYPVPPHLQPAYAELGFGEGAFPITEAIRQEVLSLPMGPHLEIDRDLGRGWIQESIEISALLVGLIRTKRAHIAQG